MKSQAGNNQTIEQAIKEYKAFGQESIHSGFRNLVQVVIDSKFKESFENDSYQDALFLTDKMFSETKKSVKMLTGKDCGNFLTTLMSSFEEALIGIKRAKGTFKIILIESKVPDFIQHLQKKYKNTLEVVTAKLKSNSEKPNHFIVVDSEMLRLEEPHDDLTPETSSSAIKARAYFNNKEVVRGYSQLFDAIWEKVKALPQSA